MATTEAAGTARPRHAAPEGWEPRHAEDLAIESSTDIPIRFQGGRPEQVLVDARSTELPIRYRPTARGPRPTHVPEPDPEFVDDGRTEFVHLFRRPDHAANRAAADKIPIYPETAATTRAGYLAAGVLVTAAMALSVFAVQEVSQLRADADTPVLDQRLLPQRQAAAEETPPPAAASSSATTNSYPPLPPRVYVPQSTGAAAGTSPAPVAPVAVTTTAPSPAPRTMPVKVPSLSSSAPVASKSSAPVKLTPAAKCERKTRWSYRTQTGTYEQITIPC